MFNGIRWIILLLLSVLPVYGQFQRLTIEDGLSQSTVYCVAQDDQGFIYFGTQDGMDRYDGYHFRHFKYRAHSLHHPGDNHILALLKDNNGRIWLGTEGGGLDLFNPEKEIFTHFVNNPADPASISSDFVSALLQSRTGTLWVGTLGGGLNRLDLPQYRFSKINLQNNRKARPMSDHILGLTEDQEGSVWAGTANGLFRYFPESRKISAFFHNRLHKDSISDNYINAVVCDSRGRVWIGTSRGLDLWQKSKNRFLHFRHNPADLNSISGNHIKCILETRDGGIWVGTNGNGLNRYNSRNNKFERYPANPFLKDKLSEKNVWSLFEDQSGVLWIGTANGGINKISQRQKSFRLMRNNPLDKNSLSDNIVWAVYQQERRFLWVGTNRGLNRFDLNSGHSILYHKDAKPALRLSSNNMRCITPDQQGRLWTGTDGGGINLIAENGKVKKYFVHNPKKPDSISSNRILCVYRDSAQRMWVGTRDNGLNLKIPGKKGFLRYVHDPKNKNSLINNSVYSIMEDAGHEIWVGTLGGISRFRPEIGKFTHMRYSPKNGASLSDNGVGVIFQDSRKNIWVGTDRGLNLFKPAGNVFIRYLGNPGMPSDLIYGILEDRRGFLWLSTNFGLTRFDPRKNTFRSFGILDGLQSYEFNTGAHYKNTDGILFFGGINGLNYFNPEEIRENTFQPPVVLTDLRVFNKSLETEMPVSLVKKVRLNYNENYFTMSFAALDFTAPRKNRYSHFLEGFDKMWIDSGNERSVSYTNVPPGKYRFRVRGTNSDGLVSKNELLLVIDIKPPFWKTWWFRGAAAVLVLLLVFLLLHLRFNRIRRQRNLLQKLVEKKTRQLKQANLELEKLALLDGLTGIPNQRQFREYLRREVSRCQRIKKPIAMLMIDVDMFKLYNDTYGHQEGNECLKKIARVLRQTVWRPGDMAARYGGEEFAVILPLADARGGFVVAQRIQRKMQTLNLAFPESPVMPRVTLSIGVASLLPVTASDYQILVRNADQAMYDAKNRGRNSIRLYENLPEIS